MMKRSSCSLPFRRTIRDHAVLTVSRYSHECTAMRLSPESLDAVFDALFTNSNMCAFCFCLDIIPHGELIMVVTASMKTRHPLQLDRMINRPKNVNVPAFTINSAHGMAQDCAIQPFLDNIPQARSSLQTGAAPPCGKCGAVTGLWHESS